MYLASFRYGARDRLGLRAGADDALVPLDDAVAALSEDERFAVPATMLELIAAGESLHARLRSLAGRLPGLAVPAIAAAEVTWHPPVRRPGKILGVAMNNSASNARKVSAPEHPMFFIKPASCLLGHREPLEVRSYYGGLHPEPELAVVIGRTARDLAPETALDAVFGYTIMNDITGNVMRGEDMVHYWALYAAPDDPSRLERREQHLSYAARYKGTDGFGPIGPWMVTRDEVPDPGDLDVVCTVGGKVVAEDSTRYYNYTVAEVLAFVSRFQTLEAGDIVSMGTAFREKPGAARSIHTADLQRVDGPVSVTIGQLGTLTTDIRRVAGGLGRWRLKEGTS